MDRRLAALYHPDRARDSRYHAELRCIRIPSPVQRYHVLTVGRAEQLGRWACERCWDARAGYVA